MEDIKFDKGADKWYAHYYDNPGMRLDDEKIAAEFGKFFSARLNNNETKEELCQSIGEILCKYYQNDKNKLDANDCFEQGDIEYIPKFKYIRFPDFKVRSLENFIIRIDINPCIGLKESMTKLYCIPRYRGEVGVNDAVDFFYKSTNVCDAIIKKIREKYIEAFSEFSAVDIDPDKSNGPYLLVSNMIGSSDEDTRQFFDLMVDPEKWQYFCKTNERGRAILRLLNEMNQSIDKGWNLNDYQWLKQSVDFTQSGSEVEGKKNRKSKGYIGFKADETLGHFIGVSDSYPRDVLLPLNLDIIRTQGPRNKIWQNNKPMP